MRSTLAFADGYLARGASGLSPLLFPNTVMNTMAAATAIALAVAAAALDDAARPALVHAIARGGTHVALVVRGQGAPGSHRVSGHPQ